MSWLTNLQIPTHPDFDFGQDPDGQPEYANPVTLANQVVRLANAHIQVAERIVGLNASKALARQAYTAATHALEDFEADLLARFPASTGDRKSNKLLDAYVRKAAFEAGEAERYRTYVTQVRECQAKLDDLELALESARVVQQSIKLEGEHLQTYLSFKKHEAEQARRY